LLEGGQYDLTGPSQLLYETDIIGHPYSTTSTRMRMWGGGTNCWGGYVCALSEDTFVARDDLYAAYPGWPIDRAELTPYFREALSIVDIDPDAPFAPLMTNHFDPFDTAMVDADFQELYWNVSPPTRFRQKFYDEVLAMDTVDVLNDHTITNIEVDENGEVTAAAFTALDGETTVKITGERYILACGGIENPRLLLWFNAQNGTSYGNVSGMLGSFFMEHPELDAAQFVMTEPSYQHKVNNHAYRFYRLLREVQLQEELPGAILRISFTHEQEQDEIIDALASASTLKPQGHWRAGYVQMSFEQLPLASNKVALSDERDAIGMPRAELHWRLAPEDYRAPRYMVNRFANLMVNEDLGRVRLFDWIRDESARPDPLWAKHHIGTTRMGATENDGCVDVNGRLFGTRNFYVMGASLFPTAGYENPTVPVIMLSLRMADQFIADMG
ncbi:MAG: GMC family oxidoreductase, partial [Chloroflexota bacterium]